MMSPRITEGPASFYGGEPGVADTMVAEMKLGSRCQRALNCGL